MILLSREHFRRRRRRSRCRRSRCRRNNLRSNCATSPAFESSTIVLAAAEPVCVDDILRYYCCCCCRCCFCRCHCHCFRAYERIQRKEFFAWDHFVYFQDLFFFLWYSSPLVPWLVYYYCCYCYCCCCCCCY